MTPHRILTRIALLTALLTLAGCTGHLRLDGPITPQSVAPLITTLAAAEGEVLLDLTSTGGSVAAGQALIAAIDQAKVKARVTTLVRENCESMCVAVWLAGEERKAFSTAHFMLHAAADRGVVNVAVTKDLHAYYKARGVDPAWLDTQILRGYLFTTKPLDLTRDELLAALMAPQLASAAP